VFQFYAIILWYCEAYYIFPTVLIIASLITYLYNVALLQQTQKKLKEDSLISVSVQILVGDADKAMLEHRKSEELVPGDLFYLKSGDKVPCDSIILIGAGLANENYITGDPYPVRKAELQNFVYKSDHENEFTLYMGT
jgi:P-type E1-E2 ATPase